MRPTTLTLTWNHGPPKRDTPSLGLGLPKLSVQLLSPYVLNGCCRLCVGHKRKPFSHAEICLPCLIAKLDGEAVSKPHVAKAMKAEGDCATLPRGVACSNSRPQPVAKTFGGLDGGGGRWVGRSAARVPRGGSVGTPTYIPQNDPHDALIILNIHKWGKKIFRKNLPISSGSHQPRSDLEVRSGVKIFSVFFKHF